MTDHSTRIKINITTKIDHFINGFCLSLLKNNQNQLVTYCFMYLKYSNETLNSSVTLCHRSNSFMDHLTISLYTQWRSDNGIYNDDKTSISTMIQKSFKNDRVFQGFTS